MDNYFKILPYEGTQNIKLGMNVDDIQKILGYPIRKRIIKKFNSQLDLYDFFRLTYSLTENLLEDILFLKNANVFFNDINILHDPNSIRLLIKEDPDMYTMDDGIYLFKIGISLSGYLSNEDKAVCVFKRGAFDKYKDDFKQIEKDKLITMFLRKIPN